VRLLLLAPPGAGKAPRASGRQIAACQERGDLVPDQIVFGLLIPVVVEAAGCPDSRWPRAAV
jgi:adenylate kinase family enzyme